MNFSEIEKALGHKINRHEIIKIEKRGNRIYIKTDRETILADEESCYVESPFFDFCLEPQANRKQSLRNAG